MKLYYFSVHETHQKLQYYFSVHETHQKVLYKFTHHKWYELKQLQKEHPNKLEHKLYAIIIQVNQYI